MKRINFRIISVILFLLFSINCCDDTGNHEVQRKIITDTIFTVIRSDNYFDWINKLDLIYGNNSDVITSTFAPEIYQKLKSNPNNFSLRVKQYDTLNTPFEYYIIDKNTNNSYKIQDVNDLPDSEFNQIIDFFFVRRGILDEYLGEYEKVKNCIAAEFVDLNSDNIKELILWANSPCFVNNRGSQFYIFRKIKNVWTLIFETSGVVYYEILHLRTKEFYNLFSSGMSGDDEVRLYYKFNGRKYIKYSMSIIPFEDN